MGRTQPGRGPELVGGGENCGQKAQHVKAAKVGASQGCSNGVSLGNGEARAEALGSAGLSRSLPAWGLGKPWEWWLGHQLGGGLESE